MPPIRRCAWCAAPLERHDGERDREWRRRRHCGYHCGYHCSNSTTNTERAAKVLASHAAQLEAATIARPAPKASPQPALDVVGYVPLRSRRGVVGWIKVDPSDMADVAHLRWSQRAEAERAARHAREQLLPFAID